MLINDLDMRIESPCQIHNPWILDPSNPSAPVVTKDNFRDNVEQIYISNPQPGNYTIKVIHKNILVNTSSCSFD